uniref:Ig-like domain-containing protein n=1 Tax=Sinocyclocheilus anshuiensis TaxID=1608454 RepID=A0A671KED7_9TELE
MFQYQYSHIILTPSETKTNISLFFAGASNADTITPDKTEEFAAEGSNVKISCSYSSALSLLWYRQYPGSASEFLVLIVDSVKKTQISGVDYRLTTNIRKTEKQNHVDLIMSSAAVSDSALYYCALRPTVTVTGNTRTLTIHPISN